MQCFFGSIRVDPRILTGLLRREQGVLLYLYLPTSLYPHLGHLTRSLTQAFSLLDRPGPLLLPQYQGPILARTKGKRENMKVNILSL